MFTPSELIRRKLDEAQRSLDDDVDDPFADAMESFYVEEQTSTAKYGDDDLIVCRSPYANRRICGKTYSTLGNFIRHLEKPNVHGLKIGDQI